MCETDLEPCAVWQELERTAAKPHVCDVCDAAVIRVGDRYLRHFSLCDGQLTSERVCMPCHADRVAYADEHEGQLCTPSYFTELVQSCIHENESEHGTSVEGAEDDDAVSLPPEIETLNQRWRALLDGIKARGAAA